MKGIVERRPNVSDVVLSLARSVIVCPPSNSFERTKGQMSFGNEIDTARPILMAAESSGRAKLPTR
jgi:hypothetical protein